MLSEDLEITPDLVRNVLRLHEVEEPLFDPDPHLEVNSNTPVKDIDPISGGNFCNFLEGIEWPVRRAVGVLRDQGLPTYSSSCNKNDLVVNKGRFPTNFIDRTVAWIAMEWSSEDPGQEVIIDQRHREVVISSSKKVAQS